MTPLIKAMLRDPDCPNEVLRDALQDEGLTMAKVYVVAGDNGQSHSEHDSWDVCAFLDRVMAEKHKAAISMWKHQNPARDAFEYHEEPKVCPYDKELSTDRY